MTTEEKLFKVSILPSIQHLQTDLKNIKDKIKSMLDSYCEKECNNNDCLDKICGKCRRLIG